MTYSRGNYCISVEQIDGFGKRPGLWLGEGNQLLKVASFGSEEKAQKFEDWLEFFMFGTPIDGEDDDDEAEIHL